MRLSRFLTKKAIRRLDRWEFMDRIWVGEAVGFTEWLRLHDDTEVLRSISLDLVSLGEAVTEPVLDQLGCALRQGLTRPAVEKMLGKPDLIEAFRTATDRETLVYRPRRGGDYRLHCTIQKAAGLTYLVVMRGDWDAVRPTR
jgi:hypothetical protein